MPCLTRLFGIAVESTDAAAKRFSEESLQHTYPHALHNCTPGRLSSYGIQSAVGKSAEKQVSRLRCTNAHLFTCLFNKVCSMIYLLLTADCANGVAWPSRSRELKLAITTANDAAEINSVVYQGLGIPEEEASRVTFTGDGCTFTLASIIHVCKLYIADDHLGHMHPSPPPCFTRHNSTTTFVATCRAKKRKRLPSSVTQSTNGVGSVTSKLKTQFEADVTEAIERCM